MFERVALIGPGLIGSSLSHVMRRERLARHIAGQLTADEASAAKLWHTELQWEVCDAALQLYGGAGYMAEYKVERFYRDVRLLRIYEGTSQIQQTIIAKQMIRQATNI